MLDRKTGFTWADLFNYSLVTLIFLLAALLIPLLIGLACFGLYLLLGSGTLIR